MKREDSNPFLVNRRMVLRGAGGAMLGLPLLETFLPRKASAQAAVRSPFVLIIVGCNGVVQAGPAFGGTDPERFWPTATGTLTKASMLADKATRSTGELSDYAEKLLLVKGLSLPFAGMTCAHAGADAQILTAAMMNLQGTAKSKGISVDTALAAAKNPAGRDPLVLHAGMYSPGGTGYDIPGYVSYISPEQPRVYIDSPYKAYQTITGVVGTGSGGTTGSGAPSAEAQAQTLRAARSKSINDILRTRIQALMARTDLSQSDRARLDQHFTAIRDIEVKISTTSTVAGIPDADVTMMKTIDPKPYDQTTHEAQIKLHLELMAFSAASDYSRVAVLKIGDREDDHMYTMNGQTFNFHEASHRKVNNGVDLCHAIDRIMLNYYKYLLDTVSAYTTPTGSLLDAGVSIWTNQCGSGSHSFANIPWIMAGTAGGFFKTGQFITVGAAKPSSGTDGSGDPKYGIQRMHNTLLTAAGVTKPGGAPVDTIGDASLDKTIFSELKA